MNYKISLAALAVAAMTSGQAFAALTPAENTALAALAPVSTWTSANWLTALDSTALTPGTKVDWADTVDECTWKGIVCDGGNITHVEIPNSGLTASMDVILAALTPAASTIVTLNLSTTLFAPDPVNVLPGDMAALSNFTSLTHLALNGSSVAGVFPDMSNAFALNYVNIYTNPGITSAAGKLAGGGAITTLGAYDVPNMSGDVTSTLANRAPGTTGADIDLANSNLYGTVVLEASETSLDLTGSDIIATGDAAAVTASGYDAATVIQPATSLVANGGEESADVSWTQDVVGEETGYTVYYTADEGVTLLGESVGATSPHNFSITEAGTYKAVVQSTNAAEGRAAAPVLSAAFDVTAGPLICEADEELNELGTACVTIEEEEETSGGGGGGAALWLVMLPLMGLLRRKRA